jgi:hypothetical protein
MAFVDEDSEDPSGNARFYNVTKAVGYGCPNEKEDTMMVQFFLKRIYTTEMMKANKPKGNMTVDGKIGPITRNWILKFQLDMRDMGNPCYADGIMDKAGNENNADNFVSSISRTKYTIRLLNNGLRKLDSNLYKTLPTNPEVPAELRAAFAQMNAILPIDA